MIDMMCTFHSTKTLENYQEKWYCNFQGVFLNLKLQQEFLEYYMQKDSQDGNSRCNISENFGILFVVLFSGNLKHLAPFVKYKFPGIRTCIYIEWEASESRNSKVFAQFRLSGSFRTFLSPD